jgi:hypothetical protein
MPPSNLVVLTIDGLAARDLGAYGNTWIETPGLDRLAARSWLAEFMMSCRPDVAESLESMVTGCLPWCEPGSSLIESISGQGIPCVLFSDQPPSTFGEKFFEAFDPWIPAEIPLRDASATSLEQTHFALFVSRLIDCQQSIAATANGPASLLWAHYGGLGQCWDAPMPLRVGLELDDEVKPPNWVLPPSAVWQADVDPDRRLEVLWAWAAQVMVIDRCLEVFFDEFTSQGNGSLVLTSPRGFPLGEHGVVGFEPPLVYGESSMVPCLAFDGHAPVGWREQTVLQTTFVHQLLSNWLASIPFAQTKIPSRRSPALCRAGMQTALRTEQWMLVRRGLTDELYAKADDRWEVNDVGRRCPEIVDELSRLADASLEGIEGGGGGGGGRSNRSRAANSNGARMKRKAIRQAEINPVDAAALRPLHLRAQAGLPSGPTWRVGAVVDAERRATLVPLSSASSSPNLGVAEFARIQQTG